MLDTIVLCVHKLQYFPYLGSTWAPRAGRFIPGQIDKIQVTFLLQSMMYFTVHTDPLPREDARRVHVTVSTLQVKSQAYGSSSTLLVASSGIYWTDKL